MGKWIASQQADYDEDGGASAVYDGEFYRDNGDGTVTWFDRYHKAPEIAGALNFCAGTDLTAAVEAGVTLGQVLEVLREYESAVNPPDRGGISLHEWNKRLQAATEPARAILASFPTKETDE